MVNNFTTNAFNFTSALQTQVDPRTGQFIVNLPIASLLGNNRLGPNIDLSLGYSPLNSYNEGFGKGFSLSGTTQLNLITNSLALSNGENYKIINGTIKVRDQKLKNFKLEFSNDKNNDEGFTIFWKEGKIEKLEKVSNNLYVTKKIISPLGKELNLKWFWSGSQAQLISIEDEYDSLLNIEYNGSNNTIKVWPNSKESYKIQSIITNGINLTNLSLLTGSERLDWNFIYSNVENSEILLTEINYPTGMREFVKYSKSQGLKFPPSSNLPNISAVISHTIVPGANQPTIVTNYEYSSQNFLGFNSNFGIWNNNSDYIYTTLTDYTYWSKATITSAEDTIITTRTYNNYHLQISEEVRNKECITLSEIEYYAKPYVFIDSQPTQFLLPKKKIETWKDINKNKTRSQVTETEFDEYGNPTWSKSPEGTITKTKWYDSEGEKECPKEPNGFTRFIKEEESIYSCSNKKTHILKEKYTYKKLGNTNYVVQNTEENYSDNILLSKKITNYEENLGKEFGRILSSENILFDISDSQKSYTSRITYNTIYNENELIHEITTKGFDNKEISLKRKFLPYKNLLLSEEEGSNDKFFTYDDLGRILSKTINLGTKYENKKTWEYQYSNAILQITEKDSLGNGIRTSYNSLGKETLKESLSPSLSDKWYTIESKNYNSLGNEISNKSSDWAIYQNKTDQEMSIKGNREYDNWGSLSISTFKNNVKNITNNDPINLLSINRKEVIENFETLKGPSSITEFDIKGNPISLNILDSEGKEVSKKSIIYDSMNRVIEEIDELGNSTLYEYDIQSRLKTQILPDQTEIHRTYAPFLIEDSVTSLSIKGKNKQGEIQTYLLGTQEFDSLGRITKTTSGGRTTSFTYEGNSYTPTKVINPSGDIIEYDIIPELNNSISKIRAGNIIQTFEFDPKTSLPLKSVENNGSELQNIWNTSGKIQSVESLVPNEDKRSSYYKGTLLNKIIEYKDFSGKNTEYIRNEDSLITKIIDDEVIIDIEYDAFSRATCKKTTNIKTKSTLTTNIEYNDLDQEISRTIIDSQGKETKLTQKWSKNGLIIEKTLEKNSFSLFEGFEYDNRNRLISYTTSSVGGKNNNPLIPKDAYGFNFISQEYEYDILNNITSLKTTLDDNSVNITSYLFENSQDPTQLTSLKNSHPLYPQEIKLEYDKNGYMTKDEEGRELSYDSLGRLSEVSSSFSSKGGTYSYDPLNRINQKKLKNSDKYSLFYRENEVTTQIISSSSGKKDISRLIKLGSQTLAMSLNDQITLSSCHQSNTLILSEKDNKEESDLHYFSPYGVGESDSLLPAFNGELKDPVSDTYHLGNGYRFYSPKLMRFNAPDTLSPFGEAGINPYCYCLGDPVNNVDPSGHLSNSAWVGIGLGIASLLLTGVTGGMSIAASGSLMAAISSASTTSLIVGSISVISDVTAIVSGSLEESSSEASSILGWISLSTGMVGITSAVYSGGKNVSKLISNKNIKLPMTTYGRNLRHLGGEIAENQKSQFMVFSDTTGIPFFNKKSRLTVAAHGTVDREITRMEAVIRGEIVYLSPEGLANHLNRYNAHLYDEIRLIMCHSANGGSNSFAQQLSNIIGKPVKGYQGAVAATDSSLILQNVIANNPGCFNNRAEALNFTMREIEKFGEINISKRSTRIVTDTGGRFLRVSNNYKPVTFYPTL